ncbi:ThiF family adenylyltransferase [Amycolatopsis sp. NPDC059657]|uniref:ThiF family adenylyltransferase n=1 Tax=Amycolatopsis sp. NPDC059657 TaxID=3346899 RepID=UPI00366EC81A
MTPDLFLLVPEEAAHRMRSGGPWGRLTFRFSEPEQFGAVVAVADGNNTLMPTPLDPTSHFLRNGIEYKAQIWYRVAPEVHGYWSYMRKVGKAYTLEGFKDAVAGGWRNPPAAGCYFALTVSAEAPTRYPDAGIPEIAAWQVTSGGVFPVDVDVQAIERGTGQLAPFWPVEKVSTLSVLLVGLGSIGSAAAHALAGYGIGHLKLLDPDRLLRHNLVRHPGPPKHVGRLKVKVIEEQLAEVRPDTTVEAYDLDIIVEANRVRPLVDDVDLVLCAADGVAARRVTGHLARKAKKDAILACVLADGAFGEIFRLRPWPGHGCLVCRRENLQEEGGMAPEPSLDAGYGTGTTHRPMTAVGGDLHLVGQLAAKATVATLLERRGQSDQKLPGEHMLIGLRPEAGWAPPFDFNHSGEIRWLPHTPPRPGCPTCESA